MSLINQKELLQQKRIQYFAIMGLCDVFESEIHELIDRSRTLPIAFSYVIFINDVIPVIIQCLDNFRIVHHIRYEQFLHSIVLQLDKEPLPTAHIQNTLLSLLKLMLRQIQEYAT